MAVCILGNSFRNKFKNFYEANFLAAYSSSVAYLVKHSTIVDQRFKAALTRQRKVFASISLILLTYAVFWCLPLFGGIIVLVIFEYH